MLSAGFTWRAQIAATDRKAMRDREARDDERRSQAKIVLDRYRGPLLDAVWQLGDRIDSIRYRDFLDHTVEGSGREQDAKLTTLFRFSQYFAWCEVVRTEVQLLRFENEDDTRLVAGLLGDARWILASGRVDGGARLWADEQRGIGELMIGSSESARSTVRGNAAFRRDYADVFAPWMERFAADLLAPAAVTNDRLRLLHWALMGLARLLDEENAYATNTREWTERASSELRDHPGPAAPTEPEATLRQHLSASVPRQPARPQGTGGG